MREWLREKRKEANMTQVAVAEKAGISRPYYTRIEGGQHSVPVKTAQKIAAVLTFDWTEFYKAG